MAMLVDLPVLRFVVEFILLGEVSRSFKNIDATNQPSSVTRFGFPSSNQRRRYSHGLNSLVLVLQGGRLASDQHSSLSNLPINHNSNPWRVVSAMKSDCLLLSSESNDISLDVLLQKI